MTTYIYLVVDDDYVNGSFHTAFSSEEKAGEYVDHLAREYAEKHDLNLDELQNHEPANSSLPEYSPGSFLNVVDVGYVWIQVLTLDPNITA